MWQTLIAVIGTLAGTGVAGLMQHRTARTARTETRRTDGLAAVAALVEALADHRRAMWVREDLRLRGEDWAAARIESHATRSAITAPLLRVQLLMPTVATAAQAAYALGHPILTDRRTAAIAASDSLVAAAGRHLAA